jgi:hypothetical protein
MACRCSPCLLTLRREMDAHRPGWKYLGCCGDEAHRRRVSDHNPDASGYAHAIDLGEGPGVPSMQWLVDRIMANPDLYPQVKYLIYERGIYYPRDGARKRGRYHYDGANAHATHLHVSIHATYTHDTRSWRIAGDGPSVPVPPEPELHQEDEVATVVYPKGGGPAYLLLGNGRKLQVTKWDEIAKGIEDKTVVFLEADPGELAAVPSP